jgi:peptidoglycan hydrolase-like protein with peptidoglycan-binding domain
MLKKIMILAFILLITACAGGARKQPTTQYSSSQVPAYPLKTPQQISELQRLLTEQGYNPGPVDGKLGNKTTAAIRKFQQNNGLPVDGQPTSTLLQQLKPTNQQSASSTAEKLRYEAKFFDESTVYAALGGAAAGAAIGGAAGGGKGAAIGAASGAAIGVLVNYGLNVLQADAANEEVDLKQTIAQIRQDNERMQNMIQTARQLIAEDKAKLEQIKQQLAQKSISKQQAEKQYADLDENKQLLEETIKNLKAKQQQWQKIADSDKSQAKDIDHEIKTLKTQIATLEDELVELDQLRTISVTG